MTPLTEQAKSQAACNRQQILCRLARSHTLKKPYQHREWVTIFAYVTSQRTKSIDIDDDIEGGRKQTLSEIYQSHTTAPSEWHTEYRMEFDELKRFIGNVVSPHAANDDDVDEGNQHPSDGIQRHIQSTLVI